MEHTYRRRTGIVIAEIERAVVNQESAVVFGEYDHLVGIVNPARNSFVQNDFAVVIVTSGMLPSSGPFRLHVDLARSLQRKGVPAFRFDLSGIGESLAVGGGGSSLERAAKEISAAIDLLQDEYGIERIALFGLCSGADDALFAATQDKRIVGLFSADGCGYRTPKFYVYRAIRNFLPKLTSTRAWRSRFLGHRGTEAAVHESLQLGTDVREFPDRDPAAKQIAELVERGVDLHFHYTGGVGEYYNYDRQFHEMFASAPLSVRKAISRVTTSFVPDSDHVAYLLEHREALVELATQRLSAMGDCVRA
jgi:hypothetical protein